MKRSHIKRGNRRSNRSERLVLRTFVAGATLCGVISLSPAAIAKDGPATSTELMAILKNAKIVDQSLLLRAALSDQEALVSAKRSSKDTDNDCKINAVMFAKTLMDTYPDQVLRVKVLLFDFEKSRYNQIVIRKGDVSAFRSGSLSKESLLGSIEITNVADPGMGSGSSASGTGGSAGVVAGPFQDKRLLLLSHIESLSQKGTNVKAFRSIFDQIEDLARQGNETALSQKIPYLFEKLEDQQKLVKQASQVGKQPSATVSHGGSATVPATAPSSAASGVPSAADSLICNKLISRRLFLQGAINQQDESKKGALTQRAVHIDHLIEAQKWKDADKEIASMEKELDVKHPFDLR
ncbi:MAG: hypothetical protein C0469_16235 [Cyanobacteria bacterium DS2.3.42]|nr:hypothetical protein [Cyanobacteria bacterium DS2.3.42]